MSGCGGGCWWGELAAFMARFSFSDRCEAYLIKLELPAFATKADVG